MWEKTNMYARERMLGVLFGFTLFLLLIYILIWNGSTFGGRLIGALILAGLLVVLLRRILKARKLKGGRATVGPLSPDERLKARSKLVTPKR